MLLVLFFLTIAQLLSAEEIEYPEDVFAYDEQYDEAPISRKTSSWTTVSDDADEYTIKFELSDVYSPIPNQTDHPNKVYLKRDYWWRPYIEKLSPPPANLYGRYLRWKRTSIDPSGVTTSTNTAHSFVGTWDPSNESDDREKPLHGGYKDVKRSAQMSDEKELDNVHQSWRFRNRPKRKNPFASLTTKPMSRADIHALDRVKRMAKKSYKSKMKTATAVVTKKTTTKTTTTKRTTTMNPSRKAKIQNYVRQTAVPNLRKLTEGETSSTTGLWDKLTGLPFYSTTAQWPTPTGNRPQYTFIKEKPTKKGEEEEDDGEYISDEESESFEAGDESVGSSEYSETSPSTEKSTSTSKARTSTKPSMKTYNPRKFSLFTRKKHQKHQKTRSTFNMNQVSSPGPDASEDEIRRYWWRLKQKKRGNDYNDDRNDGSIVLGEYYSASGSELPLSFSTEKKLTEASRSFWLPRLVELFLSFAFLLRISPYF